MQLAETSIRRPVFATVLSLMIVLIGAVSFNRLTVREYPKIDEPVVTVDTTYRGASAEIIESQITKPLEDSIAGIDLMDAVLSDGVYDRAGNRLIPPRYYSARDYEATIRRLRAPHPHHHHQAAHPHHHAHEQRAHTATAHAHGQGHTHGDRQHTPIRTVHSTLPTMARTAAAPRNSSRRTSTRMTARSCARVRSP